MYIVVFFSFRAANTLHVENIFQRKKNIKQKLDNKLVICAPDRQATAYTERPVCRQKSRHLIDWPIKEYTRLWQDGHANVGPLLTQQ